MIFYEYTSCREQNEDLCVTAEVLVKTITLLLTTKLTDLE